MLLLPLLAAAAAPPLSRPSRPNILFVNIDDLRPNLGAFGQPYMVTPNLDAFSRTAVRFTRAYAVAPHCLPSRNAYMTSRRPDTSQVWSGGGLMNFRTLGPDWVTLPSFFRDQNYTTVGQGKVFHEYGNKPAPHKPEGGWGRTDVKSWSAVGLPYFDPSPSPGCGSQCSCGVTQVGDDAIVARALHWLGAFSSGLGQQSSPSQAPPRCQIRAGQCIHDHSHIMTTYSDENVDSCCAACMAKGGCASWQWWIPSVGNGTGHACRLFSSVGDTAPCPAAANGSSGRMGPPPPPQPKVEPPFFLALGLHRPHLPWSVPQKFFDLYNESNLTLAQHEHAPRGMPPIAWHSCSREEDGCFTDGCIPKETDSPTHPATPEQQRRTRHGYYAAVSYADDRVGQVLQLLERTPALYNSTLVAVHGDVRAPTHPIWRPLICD